MFKYITYLTSISLVVRPWLSRLTIIEDPNGKMRQRTLFITIEVEGIKFDNPHYVI